MKINHWIVSVAILLLGGCASEKMMIKPDQQLATPGPDTAQIVFLRSSFVGSAIQASVFDVTNGEPEFVGILSNARKLAYDVAPGEHVFMVVSEAADFMNANLVGGMTYYAMVTPRMGAWKARFSMHPVRNGGTGEFQYGSPQFQGWLRETQLVGNSAASEAWFKENLSDIKSKQAKYWPVWQQKSAADLEARTLKPEDGVQ